MPRIDDGVAPLDGEALSADEFAGDIRSHGVVRWAESVGTDALIIESAFEVVDGEVIVEGDIMLGTVAEAQREHDRLTAQLHRVPVQGAAQEKAFLRTQRSWAYGRVNYMFDGELDCTVEDQRVTAGDPRCLNIQAAIDHWNEQTPITGLRWVYAGRIGPLGRGVRFVDSGRRGGSSSAVGAKLKRQDLRLTRDAEEGTVRHEMGHAMGLFHEHQRPDRGEFLEYKSEFENRRFLSEFTNFRIIRDQRNRVRVGRYDYNSLMHYSSLANSRVTGDYPPTLAFGTREELVEWRIAVPLSFPGQPPADASIAPPNLWNPMSRLGFEGTHLPDIEVADVDGDGRDDLVHPLDGAYYWSSGGATGWRPVLGADGAPIETGIEVFWGEFDAHPGRDVMVSRESRRLLDVASSDGTRWSRLVDGTVVDVAVADHDGDGDTDVFVLRRNGTGEVRVSVIDGGDLRSAPPVAWGLTNVAPPSAPAFAVVEVAPNTFEPVLFDTRSSVPFALLRLPRDATEWRNVFETPRGPLPSHVTRLSQLHFVELDLIFAIPRPRYMDILTYSNGTRFHPRGAPVVIRNAFEPGARLATLLYSEEEEVAFGVDLRTDLVGSFSSPGRVTILSHNQVVRCASAPVPSDLLALATVYNRGLAAQLSDRSPGDGCGVPLAQPVELQVEPDERVEIVASFVDPGRDLVSARVLVERILPAPGGVVADTTVTLEGRADEVEYVFAASTSGVYQVRVFYDTRTAAAATWNIRVQGPVCGDGTQDPGEECDDGAANSDTTPDACRTTCTLPVCGDGVVDEGETCDHPGNPACTMTCDQADECPSLTNATATLLASDGVTDTLRLEVTATDVLDGPLSETVDWYINNVLVAHGDEAVVSYSGGVPFCELNRYLTIVAASDSGGCIVFHPVDEILGCPP